MEKIDLIKGIIEILQPFEKVTREMSADSYVTISKIIPLSRALQRLTVPTNGVCGMLSEKLLNRMARKFTGIEENLLLASATLIDPILKKLAFSDPAAADRVGRFLSSEAARHIADGDSDGSMEQNSSTHGDDPEQVTLQTGGQNIEENSLWQLLDQRIADNISSRNSGVNATTEMQQYMKVANINRKQDPLTWWKEHSASYPSLKHVARKYLSLPATSVPAERLFSTAGELISARRSRLTPENVNMFLFLNKFSV